jgi:hypothetical protein
VFDEGCSVAVKITCSRDTMEVETAVTGSGDSKACIAAPTTHLDVRTSAAAKRRRKQEAAQAKLSVARQRKRKLNTTERRVQEASSGPSSTHWCVHNYCYANEDVVYVPLEARRTVLTAAKVGRAFIDSGARNTYICRSHLKDQSAAVVGANIHRPEDDPLLAGDDAVLSKAGEKWRAGLRRTCEKRELKRRRSSTSAAAGAAGDGEESQIAALKEEIARMSRSNCQLKARLKAVTDAGSNAEESPRFGTYEWLMSGEKDRCVRWGFLSKTKFCDWIRLLRAAGAEDMYDAVSRKTDARPSFEDAVTLVCIRLMRMRTYRCLEDLTGVASSTIQRRFVRMAMILGVVANNTVLRHQDRHVVEALRTPMLRTGSGFGPKDKYGPVTKQLDGFKVRVECPSTTDEHAKVHCAYVKDNCAQSTLVVDQANNLCATTPFYCGMYGETTTVKDCVIELLGDMQEGDVAITDKGYHLRDLLKEYLGAIHVKPTEMAKGEAAGMSRTEASRSRKVAQVRSVTERFVREFKRFDIFNGQPVAMAEWGMMDTYKSIASWMIMMNGPAADHLGE